MVISSESKAMGYMKGKNDEEMMKKWWKNDEIEEKSKIAAHIWLKIGKSKAESYDLSRIWEKE